MNSSPANATAAQPLTQRLPNGLVAHCYEHAGEVVALGLAVSAGGWHDPPGKDGLAHLLEHMLFGGNLARPPGDVDEAVDHRSAYSNAQTSEERTYYFITLPAAEVEFGLRYLRRVVFEPAFTPSLYRHERRRIEREVLPQGRATEWARWRDEALVRLSVSYPHTLVALRRRLLQGTGLDRPIAGRMRTRRAITLEDLRAFYAEHYWPGRAALLAVGPLEALRPDALIPKYFGDLPAGPGTAPQFAPRRPSPRPRWRHVIRAEPRGWQALGVGCDMRAAAASEVPALYLSRDLIVDELGRRLKQITDDDFELESSLELFHQHSVLYLAVGVKPRYLRAARLETLASLARAGTDPLDPAQVERVREAARYYWQMRSERTQNLLYWLSLQPLIFSDAPPPVIAAQAASVPAEQVRQAAAELAHPTHRLVLLNQSVWLWLPTALIAYVAAMAGVWAVLLLVLRLVTLVVRGHP